MKKTDTPKLAPSFFPPRDTGMRLSLNQVKSWVVWKPKLVLPHTGGAVARTSTTEQFGNRLDWQGFKVCQVCVHACAYVCVCVCVWVSARVCVCCYYAGRNLAVWRFPMGKVLATRPLAPRRLPSAAAAATTPTKQRRLRNNPKPLRKSCFGLESRRPRVSLAPTFGHRGAHTSRGSARRRSS